MINIARSGKDLMIKEPLYGLYLLNLNKIITDSIPTLAVGLQGINTILYINEEFWEKLNDLEKIAVLKHELMHICFQHITNRNCYPNHKLANIAMDLEINQWIQNLPEGCLKLDSFPTINLPAHAGTNTYYKLLQNNLDSKNPDSTLSDYMAETGDIWDKIKDILGSHDSWKEFDKLSEAEKKLVESQAEYILKECAKQVQKIRGTIPGELKGIIDELFKIIPPIFNWKAYFRRFLGYSNEAVVKKTFRKESKRFPQNAGLKIKFKQNILVAIDTSGSVSNQELLEFFGEIYHIYKSGVGVTIVECDAQIQRIYPYKGKFDGTISGRGGTIFDPVIDYYNQNKNIYTSLVFFTDGYAPVEHLKPHQKMMWVITSNGNMDNKYPGYSIQIPKQ